MALKKSDIVDQLFLELGITKKDATELVEIIFRVMKETLAKGEKIKISGFGNFIIRDKNIRKGRNPQTGNEMEIDARRVLTFRPSQVLREDVTRKYSHRLGPDGKEDRNIDAHEGTNRALNSFLSGKEIEEPDNDDDHEFEHDN